MYPCHQGEGGSEKGSWDTKANDEHEVHSRNEVLTSVDIHHIFRLRFEEAKNLIF